jgi:hypothetical protein
MISFLRLAARAAYRKGNARYCGYINPVEPGMWVGGVVGLKSILGIKNKKKALQVMDELQELGYITYTLEPGTKILTYRITHWILKCSGAPCGDYSVYTMPRYGFLCMPRTITEHLVEKGYRFEEGDAWLDLWCHTVYRDYGNAFSFLAPAIQYGKYGSVLTLETLGKRWGWEKTKVWRFFQKFSPYFKLHRLPGSYGCVIFSQFYPTQEEFDLPSAEDVMRILELIRIQARNTHSEGTPNEWLNRCIAWKSRLVMKTLEEKVARNESGKSSDFQDGSDRSVALLAPYIRAYFSHGKNCKNSRNCIYDCQSIDIGEPVNLLSLDIGELRPFWGNPFLAYNSS